MSHWQHSSAVGPPVSRLSLVVGPGDRENIRTNWTTHGSIFGGSSVGVGSFGGGFESTSFGFVPPRKSICEPIREEGPDGSDLAVLEEEEIYKRHHRPRPQPTRTKSAPQLISTTTTKPIYINHQSTR